MTEDFRRFIVDVDATAMRITRAAIEAFALQHGLDERQVADVALAVSEAMFNAMDHGRLIDGCIPMDVSFRSDAVEIAVETGCNAEERADLERQLASPLADEPPDFDLERGRGIYLIRSRMDAVRVEECSAASIRLVLVKRRC